MALGHSIEIQRQERKGEGALGGGWGVWALGEDEQVQLSSGGRNSGKALRRHSGIFWGSTGSWAFLIKLGEMIRDELLHSENKQGVGALPGRTQGGLLLFCG